MPTLLKNLKTFAVLAAMLSISANAFAISAGDDSALTTDLSKIYSEGLPNTTFKNPVPNVSNGIDADLWEYEHDDEGYHIESSISMGANVDFSNEYINTSGEEDITVMDVNLGVDGGISLGCNGLDLGLEALFEFDAGEILEYLPQYIMTNLAIEALAQIYATPLVSTIMDGLKSMQNFVAEFKQASCDMNKVMDRANEIKAANYNECVNEVNDTYGGKRDGMPAEEFCSSPHGLNKKLKEYQKRFSTWSPMSDALDAILPESLGEEVGGDYSKPEKDADGNYVNPQGGLISGGLSKGRVLAMFIPDVKFSTTKDKSDSKITEAPLLTVVETFNRAKATSRSFIAEIYKDLNKSIDDQKLEFYNNERKEIYADFDEYKNFIVNLYGTQKRYEDDDDDLTDKYDSEKIKSIKNWYQIRSQTAFPTRLTESGYKVFKIGPAEGPVGGKELSSKNTDLKDVAKEVLDLGDVCWAKVKLGEKKAWKKVYQSINDVFNVQAKTVDDLIDNITKCSTASQISVSEYAAYMTNLNDRTLQRAYLEMVSAEVAYSATQKIIEAVNFQSLDIVATDKQKLKAYCDKKTVNGANMSNVEKVAVYEEKEKQMFKNCEDYSEQMKLSDDKRNFLNAEKEKRNIELKALKVDVDKARKSYEDLRELLKIKNAEKK